MGQHCSLPRTGSPTSKLYAQRIIRLTFGPILRQSIKLDVATGISSLKEYIPSEYVISGHFLDKSSKLHDKQRTLRQPLIELLYKTCIPAITNSICNENCDWICGFDTVRKSFPSNDNSRSLRCLVYQEGREGAGERS